jgi:NAD(P)H dehydrogenase (quinone)
VKALIILAHPEPQSFNAQLAAVAARALGAPPNSALLHDLYRMKFDPLERAEHYGSRCNPDRFDVQAEQRHASETQTLPSDVCDEIKAVEATDVLILQYPMWWYTPPAMLKGWLDRVMVYGRCYTGSRRYDAGVFKGKRAMLSVTTGALEDTYRYNGRNGDIELLLWPLNFTLHYLGFTVLRPCVCFGVEGGLKYSEEGAAARRLKDYLATFEQTLESLEARETIPFNGWKDWDERGRLKPGVPGYSPFMRSEP